MPDQPTLYEALDREAVAKVVARVATQYLAMQPTGYVHWNAGDVLEAADAIIALQQASTTAEGWQPMSDVPRKIWKPIFLLLKGDLLFEDRPHDHAVLGIWEESDRSDHTDCWNVPIHDAWFLDEAFLGWMPVSYPSPPAEDRP